MAGLLTYSLSAAFPTAVCDQWLVALKEYGAYSSGYCSGFTPDSLKLVPELGFAHHCGANI